MTNEWFYQPFVGEMFREITHLPEFERDLKSLMKRFKTLEEDLQTFIQVAMNAYHKQGIDSRAIIPIANLGIQAPRIYKVKKFACRALKGRGAQSGIRVIYAYDESADKIEFDEIYFKGDKENEDRERILRHYNKQEK